MVGIHKFREAVPCGGYLISIGKRRYVCAGFIEGIEGKTIEYGLTKMFLEPSNDSDPRFPAARRSAVEHPCCCLWAFGYSAAKVRSAGPLIR